jgi:septum formation inhibitor-activating ATPase MinD
MSNTNFYKEMTLEQALISKKYYDKMLELLTKNFSNENTEELEKIQEVHNKLKEFFPELFI